MAAITLFAPAERAAPEALRSQAQLFLAVAPSIEQVLDAVPNGVMALNAQRQIIFANAAVRNLVGLSVDALLGLRPGEALSCSRATEAPGGCGTSEFCRTCGAVQAILASQNGRSDTQECRIQRVPSGDALDLRVWATPLDLAGERVTLFSLVDISDEKRRQALERTFFHDVLNTATVLQAATRMLANAEAADIDELAVMLNRLGERLIREIRVQRDLLAAENGDLVVCHEPIEAGSLIEELAGSYAHDALGRDREVRVVRAADPIRFVSDLALLGRVLGNMIKNALEATPAGGAVTVAAAQRDGRVEFSVHNPGAIPRAVQMQMFQRSFSTKGPGRGLGTYSMKLLGERYLHGRIGFESSPEAGTTFRASFPLPQRD